MKLGLRSVTSAAVAITAAASVAACSGGANAGAGAAIAESPAPAGTATTGPGGAPVVSSAPTAPAAFSGAPTSAALRLPPALAAACHYPDDIAQLDALRKVASLVAVVTPQHDVSEASTGGVPLYGARVHLDQILQGAGQTGDVTVTFLSRPPRDPFPAAQYVLILARSDPSDASAPLMLSGGPLGQFAVRDGRVYGQCVDAATNTLKDVPGTRAGESLAAFTARLLARPLAAVGQ